MNPGVEFPQSGNPNVVSSQGGGPAHLSVDPSGKWVFAANHGAGSVAVVPIKTDGSLGEAADVQSIPTSPLGPHQAQDAPRYSFADSGHDAPHAHMALTDPARNYLLLSDLGTDRIYIFKLDKTTGKLTPAAQPWMQANPGAGPRHFDFHPNGRWVYSLNEEASTLDYLTFDAGSGGLTLWEADCWRSRSSATASSRALPTYVAPTAPKEAGWRILLCAGKSKWNSR